MVQCQEVIGYQFKDIELLRSALTHTSVANTRAASNERLEFLGDAVLGLICCEQLYLRYPDFQEGEMTKVKSVVVSRRTCVQMGRKIRLHEFLQFGKGMRGGPEGPASLLADAFESLVGAVYLDGGMDAVKPILIPLLQPAIEVVVAGEHGNHKSQLQQIAQKEFGDCPRYRVLDEQGPDHNKCFKVAAEINGYTYPAAWGATKKDAQQRAAENALASIQNEPLPYPAD
ncbi:MAG: ribonuclease III [Gemmataceae bacterium]|nr:ribonuclease III [Gemmataceae bacterium]